MAVWAVDAFVRTEAFEIKSLTTAFFQSENRENVEALDSRATAMAVRVSAKP